MLYLERQDTSTETRRKISDFLAKLRARLPARFFWITTVPSPLSPRIVNGLLPYPEIPALLDRIRSSLRIPARGDHGPSRP